MGVIDLVSKKRDLSLNPIGRRVKDLRHGKFTQSELAELIGVHRQTVARIEGGREFNPSLELIQKLAGALGCTVAELVSEVPTIPSKN